MALKRSAAHARADLKYNGTAGRRESRARYNATPQGLENKRRLARDSMRRLRAGQRDGPSYKELRSHLKVFRELGWIDPVTSLQQRRPELFAIWQRALLRISRIEFHF